MLEDGAGDVENKLDGIIAEFEAKLDPHLIELVELCRQKDIKALKKAFIIELFSDKIKKLISRTAKKDEDLHPDQLWEIVKNKLSSRGVKLILSEDEAELSDVQEYLSAKLRFQYLPELFAHCDAYEVEALTRTSLPDRGFEGVQKCIDFIAGKHGIPPESLWTVFDDLCAVKASVVEHGDEIEFEFLVKKMEQAYLPLLVEYFSGKPKPHEIYWSQLRKKEVGLNGLRLFVSSRASAQGFSQDRIKHAFKDLCKEKDITLHLSAPAAPTRPKKQVKAAKRPRRAPRGEGPFEERLSLNLKELLPAAIEKSSAVFVSMTWLHRNCRSVHGQVHAEIRKRGGEEQEVLRILAESCLEMGIRFVGEEELEKHREQMGLLHAALVAEEPEIWTNEFIDDCLSSDGKKALTQPYESPKGIFWGTLVSELPAPWPERFRYKPTQNRKLLDENKFERQFYVDFQTRDLQVEVLLLLEQKNPQTFNPSYLDSPDSNNLYQRIHRLMKLKGSSYWYTFIATLPRNGNYWLSKFRGEFKTVKDESSFALDERSAYRYERHLYIEVSAASLREEVYAILREKSPEDWGPAWLKKENVTLYDRVCRFKKKFGIDSWHEMMEGIEDQEIWLPRFKLWRIGSAADAVFTLKWALYSESLDQATLDACLKGEWSADLPTFLSALSTDSLDLLIEHGSPDRGIILRAKEIRTQNVERKSEDLYATYQASGQEQWDLRTLARSDIEAMEAWGSLGMPGLAPAEWMAHLPDEMLNAFVPRDIASSQAKLAEQIRRSLSDDKLGSWSYEDIQDSDLALYAYAREGEMEMILSCMGGVAKGFRSGSSFEAFYRKYILSRMPYEARKEYIEAEKKAFVDLYVEALTDRLVEKVLKHAKKRSGLANKMATVAVEEQMDGLMGHAGHLEKMKILLFAHVSWITNGALVLVEEYRGNLRVRLQEFLSEHLMSLGRFSGSALEMEPLIQEEEVEKIALEFLRDQLQPILERRLGNVAKWSAEKHFSSLDEDPAFLRSEAIRLKLDDKIRLDRKKKRLQAEAEEIEKKKKELESRTRKARGRLVRISRRQKAIAKTKASQEDLEALRVRAHGARAQFNEVASELESAQQRISFVSDACARLFEIIRTGLDEASRVTFLRRGVSLERRTLALRQEVNAHALTTISTRVEEINSRLEELQERRGDIPSELDQIDVSELTKRLEALVFEYEGLSRSLEDARDGVSAQNLAIEDIFSQLAGLRRILDRPNHLRSSISHKREVIEELDSRIEAFLMTDLLETDRSGMSVQELWSWAGELVQAERAWLDLQDLPEEVVQRTFL